MLRKKVCIRADAGGVTGYGHFMRSLALAEMLQNDFECTFFTQSPTEFQKNEASGICKLIEMPSDDSRFQQFVDMLKGDEIVVLDNYFYSTEYQKQIKDKGCKLVCIDDPQEKHYVADVIIHHGKSDPDFCFSAEPYTTVLSGFEYVLLRKTFLTPSDRKQDAEFDFLVCVGGADPLDITNRLVTAIAQLHGKNKMAVITGNAYHGKVTHTEIENLQVYKNLNASQMAGMMKRSSIGFFPASTTAMEAMAVRLPFLTFYFADNQKMFYHYLIAQKLALPIDPLNPNPDVIADSIENIKKNHSEFVSGFESAIDYRSPQRIIDTFKNLSYEQRH